MNTPINSPGADRPDDQTDALVAEWIREAGDPSMMPDADHVAQLKQRLLAQTDKAPVVQQERPTGPAKQPDRRGWMWAALTTAAALVLLALYSPDSRKDAAWAQTRDAVNTMPWMHTETQLADGLVMESWFSPQRLVLATRAVPAADVDLEGTTPFAMFVDIRQGVRFEYRPLSDEIVKWPMLESDATSMRMVGGFFAAFADGNDLQEFAEANPDLTVSGQRDVDIDGRPFQEFDAVVSFHGRDTQVTYRIDPETNLPVSMTNEVDGNTQTTIIDFPDEGPESIYNLGVQPDVAIRDQMPAPELARLLDRRQRARMDFDRYYGITVQVQPDSHWANSVRVTRIWRDGLKWRTEYMIYDVADSNRIHNREVPANGTDPLEWWLARVSQERFRPTTLSDGTHTWRFEFDATQSTDDPEVWDYSVKPATQNPYPVDPQNPLPTMLEYPEFLMYGPTGLPGLRRRGTLTLNPDGGPEGTVLLESRTTDAPRAQGNDLSYYWLDPLENGMCRKTQMLSLSASEPELLGEQLVLDTARSPSGYLYPTRLQHLSGVVTHFYLDFDAEFDDAVFDPALTEAAPSPE